MNRKFLFLILAISSADAFSKESAEKVTVERNVFKRIYRVNEREVTFSEIKAKFKNDPSLYKKIENSENLRVLGYVMVPTGAVFVAPVFKSISRSNSIVIGVVGIAAGVAELLISDNLLMEAIEGYNNRSHSVTPVIEHQGGATEDEKTSVGIRIGF